LILEVTRFLILPDVDRPYESDVLNQRREVRILANRGEKLAGAAGETIDGWECSYPTANKVFSVQIFE
jgi:hypothetical protein